MNEVIKVLPNFKKFNSYIQDVKQNIDPIMLSGLTDGGKTHLSYATHFYTEKPILIITYNEMQAKKLEKDLKFYTENIVYFPRREIVTYDYIAESKDIFSKRIYALNQIYQNKAQVVITTIEAVCQKLITKQDLYKNILNFKVGKNYDLEAIKEQLVKLGYERYDLVEGKGQFSIRGGILDVAVENHTGIRIEFWGDEVDSIRSFDISTQRSNSTLEQVDILPASEQILTKKIEDIIASIKDVEHLESDITEIENGDYQNKIDRYFSCFYDEYNTLIDYIDDNYIIFLDEIGKIKARIENIKKDNENLMRSLVEKEKIIPNALNLIDDYIDFQKSIDSKQTIYLEKQDIGFIDRKSMHAKRNGYSFSYREVNFFRSSVDLCVEEIQKAIAENKQIIVASGSKENATKFSNLLKENDIKYIIKTEKYDKQSNLIITEDEISTGFEAYDFELLVISATEMLTTVKKKRVQSAQFREGETIVFSDLKEGDYIVHKIHGIGRFVGVNTIKADGITKDYIKIEYRDGDILYIPTNALDSIRKYIGGGDISPRLNRLGSKEFENTKAKVKSNLKEVAKELIELYAKRQNERGFAFSKDTEWQKEFEEKFEFIETEDQLRCIQETKSDMEKPTPMDRLLCGDVGYGKTEVAIRGAFKACMDQKQVAYLVPTTILANQQYDSFKERMKDYPIKIELLNRFKTKKEQQDIVKKLKLGEIDIVVGTHRLLSADVEFKNLGLLIVDEEHRFGVKDKEKIKRLKINVDVLTMTATPIPRTLHMSIVGIRDMSCIYQPPQNRLPVQTYVLEYDEDVIKEAITRELERQGQVFYLFNNVENIQKKANFIQSLVPEAKVEYAHGKLTGNQLEDIMLDFVNKKIDVLICTTILESGIDIPNANTIIVENADRLGLAQLYQIRGRVGRGNKQAYAYITYKRDKLLSEVADKRLRTIKEFTEFGSGFKIALRDLEIRGAGSILGEFQHGHMDSVGYDMYCKLLDEVIKETSGTQISQEKEIQIDLDVSSYIPDDYISDSSQKIEVYQNIALCKNEKDIQDVIDEVIDRFGNMPKEIENLIEIARIKYMAKDLGITKLIQKGEKIVFYFDADMLELESVDKLIKKYENKIKFSPAREPYITLQIKDVLKDINEFLKEL